MISRIEGVLEDVVDGVAEVRVGDGAGADGAFVYELLVPACDAGELMTRQGKRVSFHTLHYFESQGQGSHFVPRLIGFSSREQRAFFELLTTVKGIGNRKALRAMQVSHARMAEAIASGDAKFLSTLPEIGKRTAESTIVELKGKLDPFLKDPSATRRALAGAMPAVTVEATPLSGPAGDAEEMMVQLGLQRAQARTAIERVLSKSAGKTMTASEIMALAL